MTLLRAKYGLPCACARSCARANDVDNAKLACVTSGSSSGSWERHEVLDGLIKVFPVGGFLLFTLTLV